MAKGNATESQVSLKINGEQATNTIKGMGNEVKQLRRELNAIPTDTQEFINKAKELSVAEDRLLAARNAAKEVRNQMNELGDSTKRARADLLSMSPVGNVINNLADGWNNVKMAVGANVTGMNALKLAIASTGIGALVIALVALFQYFTKTDEGAKKLEGAMNGLRFITAVLMKGIQDLGEWLVKAFENPQQALKDLGEFLLNNLINRFTALGVILEGIINLDFKQVTDGTIQLASGVENATDKFKELATEIKAAADAGMQLAEMVDAYDEAQSNALVTNARLEEQISRLLLQAKDRTKSEGERLMLLDRASALETQRLQESIALANQNLAIKKLEFDQAAKTGNQTDEQYRALKEAEASVIQLRKDSIDLQEKITVRRNALLDSEAEKQKATTEAEKKAREEAEKAELEYFRRLTDVRIANIVDEGDRKRAQIEVDFKRQLEDLALKNQLTTDLELELRRQKELQLEALDKELEDRKIQKIADQEALRLERERLAIDNLIISEQEKEDRLYEVNRMGLENRLALIIAQYGNQSIEAQKAAFEIEKLDADHYKKRNDLSKKSADFEDKMAGQRLDAVGGVVGGIADLLKQDEANRRENAGLIKLFSAGEVLAMSAREISGIWANANINALNALLPGWGPAFATAQTALAVARTGIQLGNIAGAKFAQGGLLRTSRGGKLDGGQYHENGGIKMFDGKSGSYLGEAEKDEFMMILSRETYQNNKPVLDMALDASLYGGGKKIFRDGGFFGNDALMVDRDPTGGSSANSANQAILNSIEKQNSILMAIDQKLNNPQRVQAYVVYEQAASVEAEAASIRAEADA
jgi:hypothetical protein